ncbi:MAG: AAA family ATPase [Oscillatoriales cyanobacterium SM2_3_0]|nr:AAA family ATPase [Oscillatoriales cyanobacterium SM2_3_0]
MQYQAAQVVATALDPETPQFIPNSTILGIGIATELQAAYRDLNHRRIPLEFSLEASLRFVLGRHLYGHQQISEAIEQYQQSLSFWESLDQRDSRPLSRLEFHNGLNQTLAPQPYPDILAQVTPLEWQGLLQFHLGLCWIYRAEQHLQQTGQSDWQQARVHLQAAIDRFEDADRQDLVAKFIGQLGEVLRHLQNWSELQHLALRSRQLHQHPPQTDPFPLAQDYGFLAEVAVRQGRFEEAQELSSVALELLDQNPVAPTDPLKNQHRGLYLLIIAQALERLGSPWEAIEKLEIAYRDIIVKYDPRLYLKILEQLNRLYFDLGEYYEAFEVKKIYRTTSSTFGYTAFIGAGRLRSPERPVDPILGTLAIDQDSPFTDEIQASGREAAINRLLQRIAIPQYKLTVIYGQSGVGKSSILRAGLVPALKRYRVETRQVIPIIVRTYNTYIDELAQKLTVPQARAGNQSAEIQVDDTNLISDLPKINPQQTQVQLHQVIEKLRENAENNKITVLIFDQFEEFFFAYKTRSGRQIFFEALQSFLNLPFVKVILSLREDCLHYLLEGVRFTYLEAINNDVLTKDILFYLGNLTQEEAYNVIKQLTDQSHFYLEDSLVQTLVQDLSNDFDEVRPIELQMVGAQLQAENITTLVDYRQKGPKHKLVERFLEEVIHDCGPENESAARSVLYLLTDEANSRPLKTRNELAEELQDELNKNEIGHQLDLSLYILEKSGLVAREVGGGASFYQLVHDYLADFIQQQHRFERDAEFEQIVREKNVYAKLAEEREKLAYETEKRHQAERSRRRLEKFLGLLLGIFLIGLAGAAFWLQRREGKARISTIESATEALGVSDRNDQLGVLEASLQIGQSIQTTRASDQVQTDIALGLRPVITNIQERNRFEGHDSGVLGVTYSPDGTLIATAGNDQTVKLWSRQGKLLRILNHNAPVTDVSISSQGIIATVTLDPESLNNPSERNRVHLWRLNGEPLPHAPITHNNAPIASANFSPDGQTLASASWDKTIKLWKLDGTPIRTLVGHQGRVQSVQFSPDGKTLASAGWDRKIKLWKLDGKVLHTLKGHCETGNSNAEDPQPCLIRYVSFSPDSQRLVSASSDRTLKLWDVIQGQEIAGFKGQHNDEVLSANFSPDGEIIASSSKDRTIKLWNAANGALLQTLISHQGDVWEVVFSPEGQFVTSASADRTARTWDCNQNPLLDRALYGHIAGVWNQDFSPDSQWIATASDDSTVRLWESASGKSIRNSQGQPVILRHQQPVNWVSFSPGGQVIVTASQDKSVKLWDLSGQLLQSWGGYQDEVYAIDFSPDGEVVASASQDIKLWDIKGQLLQTLDLKEPAWSVEFNFTGNLMATGTSNGQETGIEIWGRNPEWQRLTILTPAKLVGAPAGNARHRGTPSSTPEVDSQINAIQFSPITNQLAIAIDQNVWFWAPDQNGSCPLHHNTAVISLSFHPAGLIVATASQDKKVRFWQINPAQLWSDTENCSQIVPLYTINLETIANYVQFSPDGNTLAIAQENGVVTLWNMQGFDLNYQIQQNCRWLADYLKTNPHTSEAQRGLCPQL